MQPMPEQLAAWDKEQLDLSCRVITSDAAEWLTCDGGWAAGLKVVAGVDLSFLEEGPSPGEERAGCAEGGDRDSSSQNHEEATQGQFGCKSQTSSVQAVAALAALSFPVLELVHLEVAEVEVTAPYKPGYLGFREVPAFLELLQRAEAAGCRPQLLLVDGFGVLHPRCCGSASHLGVASGLPTIGVAKSLLHVGGLPGERQVREMAREAAAAAAAAAAATAGTAAAPAHSSGSSGQGWLPLVGDSGEVLGAAVWGSSGGGNSGRSSGAASSRPVYVSVGHRVGLGTAVELVRRCCLHRVPEPIRRADLASRERVRELLLLRRQKGASAPEGPAI